MIEKTNPRLLLCALLILSVTGGIYLRDQHREDRAEAALYASEMHTLEEEFSTEKLRLETDSPSPRHTLPAGLKVSLIPQEGNRLAELLTEKERTTKTNGENGIRFGSHSWEGFPTTVLFTRLPKRNAFLVAEQVHEPLKATGVVVNARAVLLKKFALILAALIGLAVFVLGLFSSRVKKADSTEDVHPVQPPRLSPGTYPVQPSTRTPVQPWLPSSPAVRTPAQTPSSPREQSIEASLVEASHRATKLPSLFFRYLPREGILKLTTEAGVKGAPKIHLGGMSFALSETVLREIYAAEARKERRDLADQSALKQILRTQYGITHFDAWPVLETPALRERKLLGVLIVARATSAYLFERGNRDGFRLEKK